MRFGVVGAANTAVTLAVIWVMHQGFDAPVWLASGTGYAVGMVQGFLLSRYWTFARTGHAAGTRLQAAGFVVVNLICGAIFTRLNVLFVASLPLLGASLLATVAVLPLSFALNRWFVFRPAAG